ncbi:hypothetical protein V6N12_013078 [Hibiscus sabdariffa]|uniref:Reverse transcriptase Ty1/copia-type domain-containing protein n=1 Tax=Hibiscus sabdariffa TaxID=183260 RepID=A0ABR2EHS5_9ROSI
MSPDSEKWLKGMRSEMDSMSENQTNKGRLVAKGFRQIHGVDDDETFSPVAMFKSIRIMLAIAAFHDSEIWSKSKYIHRQSAKEANPGKGYWIAVKNILKYIRRTDDVFLVYGGDEELEAEYITTSEAAKQAVWIKKFVSELGVVPSISDAVELYCDNNGAIAQAKEPRSHQRSKHILSHFYLNR